MKVIKRVNGDPAENNPMPLEGIKIVEYGVFHAGPGGTAILGDLGADIIKVESGFGDPERYWTQVAGINIADPDGESLMHEVSNRNKKGVYIDIKTDEGREAFHRLIREADVFLTNLRSKTKTKLRIDYAALREINPDIIHANVSGYGPDGPMMNVGAFDPLGQARSGLMFTTGTSEPAMIHLGVLDQATAIAVSHAILTALFVRERGGGGQEVHVSLYSAALWLQHPNLMLANALSVNPCVTIDRTAHSPLRNRYICKDGKWIIGTHHPEEKYWTAFCQVIGKKELLDDARFTDAAGRPTCSRELLAILDAVFLEKTRDEWMGIFQEHEFMFCPIQTIMEVESDPQAIINDYVVPVDHPRLGRINMPGYPVHFSASRAGTRCPAPAIGEHTDEVLSGAGYTVGEINAMRAKGIVR